MEKKTYFVDVMVQKRKEKRTKIHKIRGYKEPIKIMHENEKLIGDKLLFVLEEQKP
jgi:hypothetical protein